MIRETIVTTCDAAGKVHVAPFGLIEEAGGWVIAPFRPSVTLDNLLQVPELVANFVDDVRVFAGCLTGRRDWPCVPADRIRPPRLAAALAHAELRVVRVAEDAQRPRLSCRVIHRGLHAPFMGFNRAQAAVVEGAILVSRLFMLPRDEVERQMAHLAVAVAKTAGPAEQEAWNWLVEAVAAHDAAGS